MKKQMLKRLAIKGTMTYIAVFSLVLMVAMPALALVANSVGTNEIRDHSIRSVDIRNKAVTTDRIAPRAVKRGKIGKRAIRTEHVQYLSSSKIKYPTKTKYRSIPAGAFQPASSTMSYLNFGGFALSSDGPWVAEVDLPDGAKITSVRLTSVDDSATVDLVAAVERTNYITSQGVAGVQSSGASPVYRNFTDNSINFPTINNRDYAYYAVFVVDGDDSSLSFGRIRITYQIKSP